MIRLAVDEVIIGAGFSGALLALMLHRAGRRVALIERGRHPRFALGESSTPMANLALEEIAREYDLPWLAPLAEHGTWKVAYPNVPVGLKRGFTFAYHELGRTFEPRADHSTELLVAASPADEVGDTHWLRADFDHLVVKQAVAAGVPYLDRTLLTTLDPGPPWVLRGEREGEAVEITASFAVDATGFDGALPMTLGIDTSPDNLLTRSWTVYSHFTGVALWADVQRELGADLSGHPFRCDDAALHHVLDGGWVWVLRFDNGVTSAGVLLDPRKQAPDLTRTPQEEWEAALARYPSFARQFRDARPVFDFKRTGTIQRRARRVTGPNWALLSSAAYSLDALFSTGNAHALMSLRRLARLIERHSGRPTMEGELARYERSMQREIDFLDRLVHGSYQAFRCFPLLAAWTMYYFAGAIASEHRRREGRGTEDDEMLFSDEPTFRARALRGHEEMVRLTRPGAPAAAEVRAFERQVALDVAPWNVAGLCDPAKRNLYPYA